jgi:uncharacterized protein (UPF0548 family)
MTREYKNVEYGPTSVAKWHKVAADDARDKGLNSTYKKLRAAKALAEFITPLKHVAQLRTEKHYATNYIYWEPT